MMKTYVHTQPCTWVSSSFICNRQHLGAAVCASVGDGGAHWELQTVGSFSGRKSSQGMERKTWSNLNTCAWGRETSLKGCMLDNPNWRRPSYASSPHTQGSPCGLALINVWVPLHCNRAPRWLTQAVTRSDDARGNTQKSLESGVFLKNFRLDQLYVPSYGRQFLFWIEAF